MIAYGMICCSQARAQARAGAAKARVQARAGAAKARAQARAGATKYRNARYYNIVGL